MNAGKLDELVESALSGRNLPRNPIERRDVELQRLVCALKACLQSGRYKEAAKLALKAGGECAGQQRQNSLIQRNTDLAAVLIAPDRIEQIVSQRTFSSEWMGSHHVYDAGLLSGRDDFAPQASSHLRMARDWLNTWGRLTPDERQHKYVTYQDMAEFALVILRLHGAKEAAKFLTGWKPHRCAFHAGRLVGARLLDLGLRDQFDALASAAVSDVWLLLGLAAEARRSEHPLAAVPLRRLLRRLGRGTRLPESDRWDGATDDRWSVVDAVRAAVEIALRVLPSQHRAWAALLRRYLPDPPPIELAERFEIDRGRLLRPYALEAALRGKQLILIDVAPPKVREQLERDRRHSRSYETETFVNEVEPLLPWVVFSADVACGRNSGSLTEAVSQVVVQTDSASRRGYRPTHSLRQEVPLEWLRLLAGQTAPRGTDIEAFKSWLAAHLELLSPDTLVDMCRSAAASRGLASLAIDLANNARSAIEVSEEDASLRGDLWARLARAVFRISQDEARVYFNRAVEIASRVGDENTDRWVALLGLAEAAATQSPPRPQTAYRMCRAAELTRDSVERDKHFPWHSTVEALVDLCPSSALAILSRWRDRRFGDSRRLIPVAFYRLVQRGKLSAWECIAFAGVDASWARVVDLKRVAAEEANSARRSVAADIAYRYIRVQGFSAETWAELGRLARSRGLELPDVHRLIAFSQEVGATEEESSRRGEAERVQKQNPAEWEEVFRGVDLNDPDALRTAYAKIRTYDPPFEFDGFFQQALKRVPRGSWSRFMTAISTWTDFGVFELSCLLRAIPSPKPDLESFRNALRDALLTVCRREPGTVESWEWYSMLPIDDLVAERIVDRRDIALAKVEGFASMLDTIGAGEFFQVAHPIAALLPSDQANEVVNFGLDLIEADLQPRHGDGEWRFELEPPQSLVDALAAFTWAGLGSPVVAERWQYAHVVRSAVEMGWTEFLEALIGSANGGIPIAFVAPGLEFYLWHARQWLLIGLCRGAMANATAVRPAIRFLQHMLSEDHVLIRELAARALRTLLAAGEPVDACGLKLDTVNRPSLPEIVYLGCPVLDKESRPAEEFVCDDEKYAFGIDIGPYWFSRLGRAFGISEEGITRRVRESLRRHMRRITPGGRKADDRYGRHIFADQETHHSHGSLPKTDDLNAYRGYHGMMLAAAVLLKERPVRRCSDEITDEFTKWLSSHMPTVQDGRWRFDWRDPRLVKGPPPPRGHDDKLWRWDVTDSYLEAKLIADSEMHVLWGHWIGGDSEYSEEVDIRSALVSRAGAGALLAALQTAKDLRRFVLPSSDDGEDLNVGDLRLAGWVVDRSNRESHEENDPWAAELRVPGAAPSDATIAGLSLRMSEDGRRWSDGAGALLRSETWTQMQPYRHEENTIPGWRLGGNRTFLKRLLDAQADSILVLSVDVERRLTRDEGDKDESESRPRSFVRYYLMEADGVAHAF